MMRHKKQLRISPKDLGIDGIAGNATTTSSWVDCTGYSKATLMFKFVANSSATSAAMTFNLQVSSDGGSTAHTLQTEATSGGTVTLVDKLYSHATDNANAEFAVTFDVNCELLRVFGLAVASGHSGETYTATMLLST